MSQSAAHPWKQRVSWVLIFSLFLSSLIVPQQTRAANDLDEQVSLSLEKAVKYFYKSNKAYAFDSFDWELIGLPAAGEQLDASKWQDQSGHTAFDYWAGQVKEESDPGKLARLAIGLMKNGYDPTRFNGVDLLKKIADSQEASGRIGDDTYTIFNHALAIIALEMYGYSYDRDKAAAYLLKRYADYPTIDDEAFALNALLFLEDIDGTEQAKEAIVNDLTAKQKANGAFEAWGSDSPDSTIEALIGLTSAGVDVLDAPWDKSISYVLSNQVADGGFQSPWSEGQSSSFTTEKALIALAAINQGTTVYERLSDEEKQALNPYIPPVDLSDQVKVYDGLANLLKGNAVKQSGNGFAISGRQLVVRANVQELSRDDKPIAILVKAMKGNQVVDVAAVEASSSATRQLIADLSLTSGTYTVEINYWYGLSSNPEVAKDSLTFSVTVK